MTASRKPSSTIHHQKPLLKGHSLVRFLRGSVVIALVLAVLIAGSRPLAAQALSTGSSSGEPGVQTTPAASTGAARTDQIIIKYKQQSPGTAQFSPSSADQMKRLSDAAGIGLTYFRAMSGDAHVLRLPSRMSSTAVQAIAARLQHLPGVEYAEPDAILRPTLDANDPYYGQYQWDFKAPVTGSYGINLPPAWDITTGSSSIVVAVVDTGITDHPEFVGRTVPGYDFISDSRTANDGDVRDADPHDPGDWITSSESQAGYFNGCQVSNSSWHGTHTAGTIGATSNNSLGVAGVNWNSKILPVRVLGKCGGYTSDIIDGMRWAAGLSVSGVSNNLNPARVINLSLGGQGTCEASMQDAINEITAAGSTIVVSAGNSNQDAAGFEPANCDLVITVAATNQYGNRASYSNYGATVEISAPGGDVTNYILSTWNNGTQTPGSPVYGWKQGTSMAAPHVSGVVSLLYSLDPSLTPAQILQILQASATHFPAGSSCSNTSNCGSGILNAGAAVQTVHPTLNSLSPASALAGSADFQLEIYGTEFLPDSIVRWNGADRTTSFVSQNQLSIPLSATDFAAIGQAAVTVFTPVGSGVTSNALTFNVTTFADVVPPAWYYGYVEGFYAKKITTGCNTAPYSYCPDRAVTRAEMAVFLLRSIHSDALPYTPAPTSTGMFADVPVTGKDWMEPWIEEFYGDGYTTGCGYSGSTLLYCPERQVTRAEMAVFVLRAIHGANYQPPAVTVSSFSDVPVAGKEWMMPWMEEFYMEGLTTGCKQTPSLQYCPEQSVTRAEMATFLDRAFSFPQMP